MATVAKPGLVAAQREQEVRDPIAGRQRRIVDPDAVAVDSPSAGPDQERPGRTEQPHAESAPLEHEPGARVQLTRAMVDQVAEQSRGDPFRTASRADAPGTRCRSTPAPLAAYSSGIAQACASSTTATGASTGSDATRTAAPAMNGSV